MIEFSITSVRFGRALLSGLRDREFRNLLLFVLLILLSGTIFYWQTEGWSPLDSLYFSVTTLTTIGSGDLAPQTALGKIFTIIYIFTGVGVIIGFIHAVAHHVNEQSPIKRLQQRNRKKTKPLGPNL